VDELFEFGQVNGVDLAVHVIQIMSYAVINNSMQDLYLLLFICHLWINMEYCINCFFW
jgi:hypothetical protein